MVEDFLPPHGIGHVQVQDERPALAVNAHELHLLEQGRPRASLPRPRPLKDRQAAENVTEPFHAFLVLRGGGCYDKPMRLAFVLLVGLLTACGYSIRQPEFTLSGLPGETPDVYRIYIPVLDNVTSRTGVEIAFTNALRETLSAVKGIYIVTREEDADFYLLGTVTDFERGAGPDTRLGTRDSERLGGLAEGRLTATNLTVKIGLRFKLLQKVPQDAKLRRELWSKTLLPAATYAVSDRTTEGSGASSNPSINLSRESVEIKIMADTVAQQVVDQVVQSF